MLSILVDKGANLSTFCLKIWQKVRNAGPEYKKAFQASSCFISENSALIKKSHKTVSIIVLQKLKYNSSACRRKRWKDTCKRV